MRWLASFVGLCVVFGACAGKGPTHALPGQPVAATVRPDAMPTELLGLHAQVEDVSKPLREAGDDAFVTGVRMWSLREGTRLRATLEVARFAPDAPSTTEAFRRHVAAQVGGTSPRLRKVDDEKVFVSAGNRQVYYTWFRGQHLVLLSIPADTSNGKAMLRAALRAVRP